MSTATYTKLRDGSWGLRLEGLGYAEGVEVTVTKKDGSTKRELAGKKLWTDGKGVILCAIAQSTAAARPHTHRRGRGCHTDGNCSSVCNPESCPCGDGSWFRCC